MPRGRSEFSAKGSVIAPNGTTVHPHYQHNDVANERRRQTSLESPLKLEVLCEIISKKLKFTFQFVNETLI